PGARLNGVATFTDAIYTPCPVRTDAGCPKRPSWSITAAKVIDDPKKPRIRFEGGRFQLFGINIPLLPVFQIARGNEGATGWLVPDFTLSSRNRLEISQPYHWQIAQNRDLTGPSHVQLSVLPGLDV